MVDLRDRLALYVVTDERDECDSLLGTCEAALRGGAGAIQLRRKHDSGRSLIKLGRLVRDLTAAYHALYIVNDRVDVALATGADGVHLGQDDMPLLDARRLIGEKLVGVSAGTVEEARRAMDSGADYLGIGAVFATRSKADADVLGLEGLRTIADAVLGCPVVAIGGIHEANADMVLDAGADGLAVVSAVMAAWDPEEAARRLRQRVEARR
jgi:thiamine-phosphate pyrophosphorylase